MGPFIKIAAVLAKEALKTEAGRKAAGKAAKKIAGSKIARDLKDKILGTGAAKAEGEKDRAPEPAMVGAASAAEQGAATVQEMPPEPAQEPSAGQVPLQTGHPHTERKEVQTEPAATANGGKGGLAGMLKAAAQRVKDSEAFQNGVEKIRDSGAVTKAREKIDAAAGYGANAALAVIRDLVNRRIDRYGEVKSLRRDGEGWHAIVQLLGSPDYLEVTMLSLELNEDCSMAKLGPFAANQPWLDNLLDDYAKGREIPIPEGMAREVLSKLPRKYLS